MSAIATFRCWLCGRIYKATAFSQWTANGIECVRCTRDLETPLTAQQREAYARFQIRADAARRFARSS